MVAYFLAVVRGCEDDGAPVVVVVAHQVERLPKIVVRLHDVVHVVRARRRPDERIAPELRLRRGERVVGRIKERENEVRLMVGATSSEIALQYVEPLIVVLG